MTPRGKIRRKLTHWSAGSETVWVLYLDGRPRAFYFLWENAITHVDNWFYDQTLRGKR